MYNTDYHKLINQLLPSFMRKARLIELLKAAVEPLKQLHATFDAFRAQVSEKLKYNAQVIYLTKYLNSNFDPINEGIWIEDTANVDFYFVANTAENKPLYLYNNYKSYINYAIDDYAAVPVAGIGTQLFKALQANTASDPLTNPLDWEYQGLVRYMRNVAEYESDNDYIVWVPATVSFNELDMRHKILTYNIAPKRFVINIF